MKKIHFYSDFVAGVNDLELKSKWKTDDLNCASEYYFTTLEAFKV